MAPHVASQKVSPKFCRKETFKAALFFMMTRGGAYIESPAADVQAVENSASVINTPPQTPRRNHAAAGPSRTPGRAPKLVGSMSESSVISCEFYMYIICTRPSHPPQ